MNERMNTKKIAANIIQTIPLSHHDHHYRFTGPH
jgi:hypothetical protein